MLCLIGLLITLFESRWRRIAQRHWWDLSELICVKHNQEPLLEEVRAINEALLMRRKCTGSRISSARFGLKISLVNKAELEADTRLS